MMDQTIINFPKQFAFAPQIMGQWSDKKYNTYIVCGMGGSHLAADILKLLRPELNLIIHSDYGLPVLDNKSLKNSLVIISSYSGNTAETIDSFNQARVKKLPLVAVTVGGKLLALSQKHRLPYIKLPQQDIQPRCALGFSLRALLKIIGDKPLITATSRLAKILKPAALRRRGKLLAAKTKGFIPIIYASARNYALAYNWKIKLNETGKIPAFYNLLPELNHNEMNGFAYTVQNQALAKKFIFIMLKDKQDDRRVSRRMSVLAKLLSQRRLPVITITLTGNRLTALFNNLLLADWLAYYTALQYQVDPELVPMVEEFKRLLAK